MNRKFGITWKGQLEFLCTQPIQLLIQATCKQGECSRNQVENYFEERGVVEVLLQVVSGIKLIDFQDWLISLFYLRLRENMTTLWTGQ